MSGSRSKKLRRIIRSLPDSTFRAAIADGDAAFQLPNIHGERQHMRVNLARRMRRKIVATLSDAEARKLVERLMKQSRK